jgi:hypothetical protein
MCPPLYTIELAHETFGATSGDLFVEQAKALVITNRTDRNLQLGSVPELAKRGWNHVFARVAVGAAIEALCHDSIIARGPNRWRTAHREIVGDEVSFDANRSAS